MQGLSENKDKNVCWTPKLMWVLLEKRCFFPDKWKAHLSFLHQVWVALVWVKQNRNLCVCVRCKATKCACVGGRAGLSRENGISPWNRGVTPAAAVPEGAGQGLFTLSL